MPRPPRRTVSLTLPALGGIAAAVALVSGIVGASIVTSSRSTDVAEVRVTRASAPEAQATTSTRGPLTTLTLPPVTTTPRASESDVRMAGNQLQSPLALTVIPAGTPSEVINTSVWLAAGDEAEQHGSRVDATPTLHPLALAGDTVFVASDGESLATVRPGQGRTQPLAGSSYLIRGTTTTASVDRATGAITTFDGEGKQAADPIPVPGDVARVYWAVDGGFLVRPTDTRSLGGVAHWSPGASPRPLVPEVRGTWYTLTASGPRAVVAFDARHVAVLDLRTGALGTDITLTKALTTGPNACMSPDGARLALGSGGEVVVVNLQTGQEVARFSGVAETQALAWTGPSQLAMVSAPGQRPRTLDVVDVDVARATKRVAAYLDGAPNDNWWIASETSC